MRKMILFCLVCLSTTAYGQANFVKPLPDSKVKEFQACSTDSDCVVATNGCCDCANGSPDVAINKKMLKAFKEEFNCKKAACTLVGGECGTGKVLCEKNVCQYKK